MLDRAKKYFIEAHVDGYMVKCTLEQNQGIASVQWFLSKDDAETYMFLLQTGMAPWAVYQLVLGEPSARSDHPTYPPHEKTYRERFGQ